MFTFHASSPTRVCSISHPPHVFYVPCLILHKCLCWISHSWLSCLDFMPQPPHVFILNTSSFVKSLCSMPPPPHVYMFHISSSTRVYVPCLLPHTCICSISHPPHVFYVPCLILHKCLCWIRLPSLSVYVPCLLPHTCVCSISHPPHVFMFHASTSTRVCVEYVILR